MDDKRLSDQFNALDESFGVESDMSSLVELGEVTTELSELSTRCVNNSLVDSVDDATEFIALRDDLIKAITRGDRMLDIMDEQVLVGVPASTIEAVAALQTSVTAMRKELRMLLKDKADIGLKLVKIEADANRDGAINNPRVKGSVSMSPTDLMEMLEIAKGASNMNAVDAEFEVQEVK